MEAGLDSLSAVDFRNQADVPKFGVIVTNGVLVLVRAMAENPDTATLNSRNSASVLMPSLLMLSERDLEGELPSTACWKKPSTKVAKQLLA